MTHSPSLGALEFFVASQCLLVSFFLLLPRQRSRTSRTALGVLLCLLGAHLGIEGAQAYGWLRPGVTPVDLFGLLYGPVFFVFVRSLAFRRVARASFSVFHFAPFVLFLATLPWNVFSPVVLALAVWVSLGAYLGLSLRALSRYRRIIESTRSDIHQTSLNWLRYAIFGLIAICVLDIASFLGQRSAAAPTGPALAWVLFTILLVYVYGFVVAVLKRPRLFDRVSDVEEELVEVATVTDSQEPVAEDTDEFEEITLRMVRERLYAEPQITLPELAERLHVQARRLSELVNGVGGLNFSEWINGWRIHEAKRLLASEQDAARTILDILYDSGFNSKSTFNAAFKKAVGETPRQFRRRAQAAPGRTPE
jgi:AraC-like DNA-binding protein